MLAEEAAGILRCAPCAILLNLRKRLCEIGNPQARIRGNRAPQGWSDRAADAQDAIADAVARDRFATREVSGRT
jgi:hypothetical protein